MYKKIYEYIIQISEMWLIWQEKEHYGGILHTLIISLPDGREREEKYKFMFATCYS